MNDHARFTCNFTRREFLTTTALAGAGMLIGASAIGQPSSATRRKRYALVGVGGRSSMYREAILKTYAQHHEMVGFCDVNLGRLKLAQYTNGGNCGPMHSGFPSWTCKIIDSSDFSEDFGQYVLLPATI